MRTLYSAAIAEAFRVRNEAIAKAYDEFYDAQKELKQKLRAALDKAEKEFEAAGQAAREMV